MFPPLTNDRQYTVSIRDARQEAISNVINHAILAAVPVAKEELYMHAVMNVANSISSRAETSLTYGSNRVGLLCTVSIE